jgi:hypothetical protein
MELSGETSATIIKGLYTSALVAEIRLAFATCNLAESERRDGKHEASESHVSKAREYIELAKHYLRQGAAVIDTEQLAEIRQQLAEMESRLSEFQRE